MRRLLIVLFVITWQISPHISKANNAIEELSQKLGVRIVTNELVAGSWESIEYELPGDTVLLNHYISLLDQEFSKYPRGYFNVIGIRTIALAQNLRFSDQERSAIPDPYRGILYLEVDAVAESETYTIHVMHHELHHCAEYYYWHNMNYEWEEWSEANNPAFRYKGGGVSAYSQPDIDWYTFTNPSDGMLNLYCTTAQEEDRSELVAAIMTDKERAKLSQILRNDEILQHKVLLIKILLSEISGTEDNYWNRVFDW